MNTEEWSYWSEELHSDPEQVKRQDSARKADLTPKEINENYAVFKGSKGDYKTTLAVCDCRDFRLRKRPCKHMYRLASELGVFDLGDVETRDSVSVELRIDDAMKIVDNLPEDLQKTLKDLLYEFYYGSGEALISKEDAAALIDAHLVKEYIDKKAILNTFKKPELVTFLPADVNGNKMKKTEIIDYLIENVDIDYDAVLDPYKMVVIDDSVERVELAMYRRLCQRFPTEREDWWG